MKKLFKNDGMLMIVLAIFYQKVKIMHEKRNILKAPAKGCFLSMTINIEKMFRH